MSQRTARSEPLLALKRQQKTLKQKLAVEREREREPIHPFGGRALALSLSVPAWCPSAPRFVTDSFLFCVGTAFAADVAFGFGVIYMIQRVFYTPATWQTISSALVSHPELRFGYLTSIFVFAFATFLRYWLFPLRIIHLRSPIELFWSKAQPDYVALKYKVVVRSDSGSGSLSASSESAASDADVDDEEKNSGGDEREETRVVRVPRSFARVAYLACVMSILAGLALSYSSMLTLVILPGQLGSVHDSAAYSIGATYDLWALANLVLRLTDTVVYAQYRRQTGKAKPSDIVGLVTPERLVMHVFDLLSLLTALTLEFFSANFIDIPSCPQGPCKSQAEYALALVMTSSPLFYPLNL